MSYIFKFKDSDKVVNYVNTFPDVSYYFYKGNSYLNNKYNLSGAFTSSVDGVPPGWVALTQMNVDRDAYIDFPTARDNFEAGTSNVSDPFRQAVDLQVSPTDYYHTDSFNPKINSFMVKGGTHLSFKTVSTLEFDSYFNMGDAMTGSYVLSGTVEKLYWNSVTPRYSKSSLVGLTSITGSVSRLMALGTTLDYYQKWSPHFVVSSSAYNRDLTSSVFFGDEGPGACEVGMLGIPAILYGDSIKKGSIDLRFFVTGTMIAQLKDENRDGALVQVGPADTPYSGNVAGVALYNEGFIVLTGSWDLTANATLYGPTHTEDYGTANNYPSWVNFAQMISSSATGVPVLAEDSACQLDFKAVHEIPVLTLFANAPKNLLNHSNNTTYRDYNSTLLSATGSTSYVQAKDATIKNIVSSSYNDPTASFQKVTYISKIGIYDDQMNLLGIAKVAKPVKKLEERDLTFKLKLDL